VKHNVMITLVHHCLAHTRVSNLSLRDKHNFISYEII